jgi:hypothetical protein
MVTNQTDLLDWWASTIKESIRLIDEGNLVAAKRMLGPLLNYMTTRDLRLTEILHIEDIKDTSGL